MPRTLEQLPGPSGLPFLGNALQITPDQFHLTLLNWSKKFGPIFAFRLWRRPIVVVSEPSRMMSILRSRPKDFRRTRTLHEIFREMGTHGLFTAEGTEWRKQRSLVTRGLGISQIKSFYPEMLRMVDRLEVRLRHAGVQGKSADIQKEFMRFTIDVSCNIAFGYDPKSLINDDDQLQRNLEIIFPMIGRRLLAPFPYWRYFKLPRDRNLERALTQVREVVFRLIQDCRNKMRNQTTTTTILEEMVMAKDDEHGSLSDEEIYGNVITLMLAGEDTTANSLAWMVYYLAGDESLQQKLYEEAETLITSPESHPRFDQLEKMRWMDSVAQESMRLKPVGPFLFIENLEKFDLDGTEIPPGTTLSLLLFGPYLDEKYFSQPLEFKPERWMPEENAGFVHEPSVFMPFGFGPRFCPGSTLAMAEIKAAMATLIRRFVFERATTTEPREVFNFTTTPKGLQVYLRPRHDEVRSAQASGAR